MPISYAPMLREFLQKESAGGIVLIAAAALALVVANSPLAGTYAAALELPIAISAGAFSIDKPSLLWINDGLKAVFFFLVGLEVAVIVDIADDHLGHRRLIIIQIAMVHLLHQEILQRDPRGQRVEHELPPLLIIH